MQQAPEQRRYFQAGERANERDLKNDRTRLFRALEDFVNMRREDAAAAWAQFRKRWPEFFPEWDMKQ
jgi:hypothetical protein